MRQFFGKYRGQVATNVDPMLQGRLQVRVPAVLGEGRLSWALPCVPYAGNGVGFVMLPPVGANVWVEFEGGDPDFPIWTGCFWGTGELPTEATLPAIKVIKTDAVTLQLSDVQGGGGVKLQIASPAVTTPVTIGASSAGIELSTGASTVKLDPSSGVNVNNGALEVLP